MSLLGVWTSSLSALGLMIGVSACSSNQVKLYPVNGKIEMTDGDVSVLAGSTIEAALENEPTLRASGVIQADGSFTLETLDAGVIRKGAREGTYKARILLGDDDPKLKRAANKALNRRFRDFETSELKFQVPAEGGVNLKVSGQ